MGLYDTVVFDVVDDVVERDLGRRGEELMMSCTYQMPKYSTYIHIYVHTTREEELRERERERE